MGDLAYEIKKAWHARELEIGGHILEGMPESEKGALFVEGQFRGLKDALCLIAAEIEQLRTRVEQALPSEPDEM